MVSEEVGAFAFLEVIKYLYRRCIDRRGEKWGGSWFFRQVVAVWSVLSFGLSGELSCGCGRAR